MLHWRMRSMTFMSHLNAPTERHARWDSSSIGMEFPYPIAAGVKLR